MTVLSRSNTASTRGGGIGRGGGFGRGIGRGGGLGPVGGAGRGGGRDRARRGGLGHRSTIGRRPDTWPGELWTGLPVIHRPPAGCLAVSTGRRRRGVTGAGRWQGGS
ncbi:hypothetical protein CXF29_06965 [Corynebacterium bovis]|nr:hypothetical protein CXF29_06965 [Corynebacterium bovis]